MAKTSSASLFRLVCPTTSPLKYTGACSPSSARRISSASRVSSAVSSAASHLSSKSGSAFLRHSRQRSCCRFFEAGEEQFFPCSASAGHGDGVLSNQVGAIPRSVHTRTPQRARARHMRKWFSSGRGRRGSRWWVPEGPAGPQGCRRASRRRRGRRGLRGRGR